MEKLKQSISKDLPITLIYLDEVAELWNLLEQNKKEYGEIEVTTKEHKFQNIKEFQELPIEKIHNLKLHLSNPYISIDLSSYSTRLYASEDTNEIIGLVTKIEAILLKGKRRIVNFISNPYLRIFFGAPFGIILGLLSKKDKLYIILTIGFLVLFLIIFSVVTFRLSSKQHSTIILSYRKNNKTFWNENKNQIILLIIGALVGTILTILGQIIFKKYL